MTQALRESLHIPGWLPPWMRDAMVYQFEQRTHDQALQIIDPRQEVIRENIRVAPGNSTSVLLDTCWFQYKNNIYPDFLNKNVLDIGGGFGGIAPVLSNSASQIIVVDPIFNEKNLESLYLTDLSGMENRTHLQFDDTIPVSPECLQIRAKNIVNTKKVYEEVLWWKTYDPNGRHKHIKRNPSYGEHLVWIPSNSQDFVFVNYVFLKTTVRQIEFLNEMNRVLKTGWQIIISDYEMPEDRLSLVWSKFTNMSIIQNNGERFIGMGRKM
jgi:SAM-dependent methyltransferase